MCVCVRGAVRGVTFQLCLMPGSFGKSSSSAGMVCRSEWAGAGRRDSNSLKVKKIETSDCGSTEVPQLYTSRTTLKQPAPLKCDMAARTPHLTGFLPKSPQLMLFSVADMILCGAVCNCLYRKWTTKAAMAKPIIKSVIPIINSHAVLTSREKKDESDGFRLIWGFLIGGTF